MLFEVPTSTEVHHDNRQPQGKEESSRKSRESVPRFGPTLEAKREKRKSGSHGKLKAAHKNCVLDTV